LQQHQCHEDPKHSQKSSQKLLPKVDSKHLQEQPTVSAEEMKPFPPFKKQDYLDKIDAACDGKNIKPMFKYDNQNEGAP